MRFRIQASLIALAAAAALVAAPAQAQTQKEAQSPAKSQAGEAGKQAPDPRPRDATRNLPSDTGSQTTQPSGAVTGAGHPQGTLPQPDVGKPGGLEERAREDARPSGKGDDQRGSAAGETRRQP